MQIWGWYWPIYIVSEQFICMDLLFLVPNILPSSSPPLSSLPGNIYMNINYLIFCKEHQPNIWSGLNGLFISYDSCAWRGFDMCITYAFKVKFSRLFSVSEIKKYADENTTILSSIFDISINVLNKENSQAKWKLCFPS